jgi:hypothetical protein
MDTGKDRIGGLDPAARERIAPAPARHSSQPQRDRGGALSIAASDAFSIDKVIRFFEGVTEPPGNPLVSEMVDEDGPLPGRETARVRPRSGGLEQQFSDDGHPILFAPNDAPDALPDQSTELDRLLRLQEFRGRRHIGV